jgi:hypothetical protein
MSRLRVLRPCLPAIVAALALTGGAGAAPSEVSITVDRSQVSTELGRKFSFSTTIANNGSTESDSLIAHLNVLSLQRGVYVDPEDWSSDRTRYLGTLAAGESTRVTWNIHAVNDGSFAAYITVLPQAVADEPPTTGRVVEFDVKKKTTLNSGGILPLALGIPGALALLAAGMRYSRRRR